MAVVARHVLVTGRVQGVAFRWYTRERARSLGVGGWVRNLRDGRVEAHLEGEPVAVDALVEWMRSGPPSARVLELDEREVEAEGAGPFDVV